MGMTATAIGSRPLRPRLALALLIVPVFMTAVDMTVLFLAMPEIAATLQPGPTQQLWILHVGDLLGAGLVLTAGTLAGRLGPRRLLALGLVAYGAASLLAALAPNADVLIVARGLIGAAGVTLLPAAVAIVRQLFTDEIGFARAVGLLMAAFSGGMAVGPPLGGLLLDAFWWGAIFLVNVPITIVVLSFLPLVGGSSSWSSSPGPPRRCRSRSTSRSSPGWVRPVRAWSSRRLRGARSSAPPWLPGCCDGCAPAP